MSDVMNALGFAAEEFEEVDTEWGRMQDHAPVDMNSRAAQEIGHRWHEKNVSLQFVRELAENKFKVWGKTAERFGTGVKMSSVTTSPRMNTPSTATSARK